MKKSVELEGSERSLIINALASYIDVLEAAKKVFPNNEDLKEDSNFTVKRSKDLIRKILLLD